MVSVQCETLLVKYMLLTFIILDSEKVSHISIPRVNVVESNVKVIKTPTISSESPKWQF